MPTVEEILSHFKRVLVGKRFHFGGYEWQVKELAHVQSRTNHAFVTVYAVCGLGDDTDTRKLTLEVGPASFDVREQVWNELPFVIDGLIESQRWALHNGKSHMLFDGDQNRIYWLEPSGERLPCDGKRRPLEVMNEAGEVIGTMEPC